MSKKRHRELERNRDRRKRQREIISEQKRQKREITRNLLKHCFVNGISKKLLNHQRLRIKCNKKKKPNCDKYEMFVALFGLREILLEV